MPDWWDDPAHDSSARWFWRDKDPIRRRDRSGEPFDVEPVYANTELQLFENGGMESEGDQALLEYLKSPMKPKGVAVMTPETRARHKANHKRLSFRDPRWRKE